MMLAICRVTAAATPVDFVPSNEVSGPIFKADRAVVIDGVLDDACWEKATLVPVDHVWGKNDTRSECPPMVVRFCWDDHYLYIGYETFDENLMVIGKGRREGPEGNKRRGCELDDSGAESDVVEFVISFGGGSARWEIFHNALNQFSDVLVKSVQAAPPAGNVARPKLAVVRQDGAYIEDDGEYKLATAVHLKAKANGELSTVRSGWVCHCPLGKLLTKLQEADNPDTGYCGEIRLPWFGIGAPADARARIVAMPEEHGGTQAASPGPWRMANREILILSMVQNSDLDVSAYHSSPSASQTGGRLEVHLPRYKLVDKTTHREEGAE
jgi:hypothetical protein